MAITIIRSSKKESMVKQFIIKRPFSLKTIHVCVVTMVVCRDTGSSTHVWINE